MAVVKPKTTSSAKEGGPSMQEMFDARQQQSESGINQTFDTSLSTQKKGFLDAYNAGKEAQSGVTDTTRQAYQTAGQDLGVQANRNDRMLNKFASVRDVNHGLGSQQALSLAGARAGAAGTLAGSQKQSMAEAQRQAAMVETDYKNRVAQALADNDYKRAAALMDEYNNQNTWREQQAKILASYGNFDAYAQLYGQDTALGMRGIWIAQQPDLAYAMGAITKKQYKKITGMDVPADRGYGGGGGSWYGGYIPPAANNEATNASGKPIMPDRWTYVGDNIGTPTLNPDGTKR